MKIKATQPNIINNKKESNKVSHKGVGTRELMRSFANPDSLATTLALECAVTSGRGTNAYKRGGMHELRERALDDVTSAIFWMGGVDIFNKLGNKFGEKVLKLPITEFDVGEDALRKPFKNLSENIDNKISDPVAAEKMKKTLAKFKFTKVVLSSALAIGFVGFVLPKINQALTRFLFSKQKEEKNTQNNDVKNDRFSQLSVVNITDFENKTSSANKPSFKGLTTVAHLMENNRIVKMLTSDVGILTGRATTARNKDEAIEYAFRDSMSPIFYYASTPLIYNGLQKLTKSVGLTSIDPVASKQMTTEMINQLGGKSMNVSEFAKKTMGTLSEASKNLLETLPFESDVISLDKIKGKVSDEIFAQAQKMAKLQPEIAGVGGVLTKTQFADVLRNGALTTPSFMVDAYTSKFGDKLTNPLKFIPKKIFPKCY